MKKILTFENGVIVGPFDLVEKVDNGYMADNNSYQTTVTGEVIVSEVDDDYKIPQATTEQVVTDAPTTEGAV
jgi:hypothetical protein